jgi:hypothetical protein
MGIVYFSVLPQKETGLKLNKTENLEVYGMSEMPNK